MLPRVETRGVDRNDARIAREGGPRAGREVLQARADREDDVRARRNGVGASLIRSRRWVRYSEARHGGDWRVRRWFRRQECRGRAAKAASFGGRFGILHAAARDDDGPLGPGKHAAASAMSRASGRSAADAVHALLEEFDRIVIGQALHVLRAGRKERRSAIGGIEHSGDRCGSECRICAGCVMRSQYRVDRLESVVHAQRRIAEMFDLLQHRIRQAVT